MKDQKIGFATEALAILRLTRAGVCTLLARSQAGLTVDTYDAWFFSGKCLSLYKQNSSATRPSKTQKALPHWRTQAMRASGCWETRARLTAGRMPLTKDWRLRFTGMASQTLEFGGPAQIACQLLLGQKNFTITKKCFPDHCPKGFRAHRRELSLYTQTVSNLVRPLTLQLQPRFS